jgi:hypothetical protein
MPNMDEICKNCGRRYGEHRGNVCPLNYTGGKFEPADILVPADFITAVGELIKHEPPCKGFWEAWNKVRSMFPDEPDTKGGPYGKAE